MRYVCKESFIVFDLETLLNNNNNVIFREKWKTFTFPCPISGHNHNLIGIDDLLVHPLIQFWKMGYGTVNCCASHVYKKQSTPYILFRPDPKLENYKIDLKPLYIYFESSKQNKSNLILRSYNKSTNSFRISTKINKMDDIEKVNNQFNFILWVYDVISILKDK